MSSQRILGKNKRRDYIQRLGISALIFFGAFAVSFFAVSNFTPATDSSATDMKLENNIAGQYININTLGNIDIDLTASPTGETSVAQDTLTIDTNARTGYKIYVSTPEDAEDTALHHTDDSVTKTIPAISSTKNSLGKIAKNSWGYTMSRKSSKEEAKIYDEDDADPENGEEVFAGIPSFDNTDMIYYNTTPTVEETNTVDIYYGVNADTSIPSGSYQADVLYTAVAETAEWNASIAPVSQKGLAAGQKIIVATDIYPGGENPDYGTISVKIGDRDCTNITPMIIDSGSLNISCLAPAQSKAGQYDVTISVENYHREYRIREGYKYIYEYIGILQNFDCTSIDINEEIKLRDIRDDNVYRVKRFVDGNCWTMEALRLIGPRTLTSEDTDIATGSFKLGYPDQSDWCSSSSADCLNQTRYYDNTAEGSSALYNWYTATAGTGTSESEHGYIAPNSICPKGWHLPKDETVAYGYNGGHTDELISLSLSYYKESTETDHGWGFTKEDPLELENIGSVYYGHFGGGTYIWTGTASSAQESFYYMGYTYYGATTSGINGSDFGRFNGFGVRCVASRPMGTFSCDDIPEIEGTKELVDMRTGYTYTVVKARDGKCWSTQNQDLDLYNKSGRIWYEHTINESQTAYGLYSAKSDWCLPDETDCLMDESSNYGYHYHLDSGNKNYGTYYGWLIASTGNYTSNRDTDTKTTKTSFCPNSWRLPTRQEWQNLYNSYGSAKALLDTPLKLELSGYHLGAETLKQGEEGYYWTANYEDDNNAYAFHINKSGYGFDKYNERYGFALRCISEK